MEPRKRYQKSRIKGAPRDRIQSHKKAESRDEINERRRLKYRLDSEHRKKTKQRMRDNYRKDNPREPKPLGLQESGMHKEVTADGLSHPVSAVVYTIPMAATALGKTPLTLRRWINEGLIPPPILQCTTHGYMHYSQAELQLISKLLYKHSKEYDYLHSTHQTIINSIWQSIEAHRKSHI